MLQIRDDAGDLPIIPIGPVESYNDDRHHQVAHYNDKGRPIESQFIFHDIIGEGGFSIVRKATCRHTGETFAIKVLDKAKIREDEFPRVILEIETLSSLSHPFICKLYSVFYTRTKIYMVLEYCYTDLFEYLSKLTKPMPETEARVIFLQLLSALHYLHRMGIVHRDIKPENILLTKNMEIRLSDFGLASTIQVGKESTKNNFEQLLFTYCGSTAYCAPEIILGIPYCGVKADIWSLGVNLYVLLASELPFWAKTPKEAKARIINAHFHVRPHFSPQMLALLRRILKANPLERPTLEEILSDPWIQKANLGRILFAKLNSSNAIEYPKLCAESALQWCHKPNCRTHPVEVDVPIRKSRIRWIIHSTRKKLQKIRNVLRCRR